MDFLPIDYVEPAAAANGYMKLLDGDNKFRIMSQPLLGWEDWLNKKPIRFEMDKKPDAPVDETKPIKLFWAMIVWNYAEKKIQILQITQARLRKALAALCKDEDWGSPYGYDIKITKEGKGMETIYTLNPIPHKALSAEIIKAYADKPIYLPALMKSLDPFAKYKECTPRAISQLVSKEEAPVKQIYISGIQLADLEHTIKLCSDTYVSKLWKKLNDMKPSVMELSKIPLEMYEPLKLAMLKHTKEINGNLTPA